MSMLVLFEKMRNRTRVSTARGSQPILCSQRCVSAPESPRVNIAGPRSMTPHVGEDLKKQQFSVDANLKPSNAGTFKRFNDARDLTYPPTKQK